MTSPGGVDARSGKYVYENIDLIAGTTGTSTQIALKRVTESGDVVRRERFSPFSHNWDIIVTETPTIMAVPGDYGEVSPEGIQISVLGSGVGASFRDSASLTTYTAVTTKVRSWLKRTGNRAGNNFYYTYTSNDGTVITFRPFTTPACMTEAWRCAYASSIVEADGASYTLNYDEAASGNDRARLRSVVSNTGYALMFEYYPTSLHHNLISKACLINLFDSVVPTGGTCPAGVPTTTYTYSGNRLTQVNLPDGRAQNFTTTYTNDTTDYTISFYKGGESQPYLVNSYDMGPYLWANYRVVSSQVFTGGPTYNYRYLEMPSGDPGGVMVGTGYSYDGKNVSFGYGRYKKPNSNDESQYLTPGPTMVEDELGRITRANYCTPYPGMGGCNVSPPLTITDPEGRIEELTYSSSLNVIQRKMKAKPGSGEADLVETAQFLCSVGNEANCKKPIYVVDTRGNRTDYSYATHGGLLTAMPPAPVAGGARPLTVRTYVQKYAYIKNAVGALVPAATPIWVPATETQCQTVAGTTPAATCDSAAPKMITTYEYGAPSSRNALRAVGVAVTADGQTLRTCYGYDTWGRKISETKPAANLSVCP